MNFTKLKKQLKAETTQLTLTQDECAMILNLIGDSNIQVRNIQPVYDLVYKLQEYIQIETK